MIISGGLIWWFFMRGDDTTINPNPNAPTSTTPTIIPTEKTTVIYQEPTLAYFPNKDGSVVVINQNGKINLIAKKNVQAIGEEEVKNLIGATFSYDGTKILAYLGERTNPTASVFDLKQKNWRPLKDVRWPASWSPNDYRLAYFSKTKTGQSLLTIDLGNAKAVPKKIADFSSADLIPHWTYPTTIILKERSSAYVATSIWKVDLKTNLISTVLGDRLGLQSTWDRTNNYGLISMNNNTINERLSLIDLSGKILRRFNFLTLPEKCIFGTEPVTTSQSGTSTKEIAMRKLVYCAIPRDAEKLGRKILPDEYWQGAIFTNDDIFKIDLESGDISPLDLPEKEVLDATNIETKNGLVYFINRLDGLLHAVSTSY